MLEPIKHRRSTKAAKTFGLSAILFLSSYMRMKRGNPDQITNPVGTGLRLLKGRVKPKCVGFSSHRRLETSEEMATKALLTLRAATGVATRPFHQSPVGGIVAERRAYDEVAEGQPSPKGSLQPAPCAFHSIQIRSRHRVILEASRGFNVDHSDPLDVFRLIDRSRALFRLRGTFRPQHTAASQQDLGTAQPHCETLAGQ
jgi:hypothetical protein